LGQPKTVPIEAAQVVLEMLVSRNGDTASVARMYGERFEVDPNSAARLMRRIQLREQPTLNEDTLDRLCLLAGTHVDLALRSVVAMS
jgi:hypothetical protein